MTHTVINFLINVVLYIWQLPQNILGLFVISFSRAWKDSDGTYATNCSFGVSLGKYIIIDAYHGSKDVMHEQGHQKQSLYLGWLYLFTIGILSATGNLWDRVFHSTWDYNKRIKWHYSQPWEAWADKLGGVKRW